MLGPGELQASDHETLGAEAASTGGRLWAASPDQLCHIVHPPGHPLASGAFPDPSPVLGEKMEVVPDSRALQPEKVAS